MLNPKAIFTNLFIISSFFLVLNTQSQIYGQLAPLYGDEHFHDCLLYPDSGTASYRTQGMDPSEAESRNGIIFSGEGESDVTTVKYETGYIAYFHMCFISSYIEHVPSAASSAGEGIVIRFKYPVNKFGISRNYLGSGWVEQVYLRAYTLNGTYVGTAEIKASSPYDSFGFEIVDGPGITTVVMDYGGSEIPENIQHVFYKYETPQPFQIVLPQIAHGTEGGADIECELMLFWDRSVNIKTFSSDGYLLPLPIFNEGNEFSLECDLVKQCFFKSKTIPGEYPITVGYVVAESDYPLEGQVVYRSTTIDGKVYEADIRSCSGETYLQIPFEINQIDSLDAAVAIVNPGETEIEIEIDLDARDLSLGFLPTCPAQPPVLILQPGEHMARFMYELLETPIEDGNHILELRSSEPFAATAYYTRNGVVVGNLPIWSYKEGQAR